MMSKLISGVLFFFMVTMVTAQFKNPKNLPFTWKTDTIKSSVDLSEIQIVLPKGSFPSLDKPKFVGKDVGMNMFFVNEPVIVVEINGFAKAYSLNILTAHEIANDVLESIPILVTYCPLCNSGVVYNRNLAHNGVNETLEFEAYPNGEILSKETGFLETEKRYGYNPYKKYDEMENPIPYFFNSDKVDKRLPAMERVVDIENNGDYKIYSFTAVAKKGVINDTFKTSNVVLFYKSGTISVLDEYDISVSKNVGSVTVFNAVVDGQHLIFNKKGNAFVDTNTRSKWDITGYCTAGELKGKQLQIAPHSNHFAFAWFAFNPTSEIYKE